MLKKEEKNQVRLKRRHRNKDKTTEQKMHQFLRRVRRDVRAMGVVTLGVSLSAITASGEK